MMSIRKLVVIVKIILGVKVTTEAEDKVLKSIGWYFSVHQKLTF
jgi:hypothetical protein